ncbi:MAG TPA: LuxR C-terminal-related transcriptional regulator [Mycobacteriales bacterium]|jgi:DNA-binding CsgD family transcriptional regulator|nr:LuxR C-terminal-related transcriptional regulator [Mycobacteriales bacterium]
MTGAPAACAAVIGRAGERAGVDAFLAAAALGPATLVVRGEAGIGKSTLWRYALDTATARGFAVFSVRAVPAPQGERAGLEDLFGPGDGPRAGARESVPAFDRGRRIRELLRRLSADTPVLVGVDDQQWLDAGSANALRFAVDRLADERIGVVVTTTPADEVVVVDGRHARQVELGPLPVDVLRQVLARSLPAVTRPELVRAHAVSDGNPTAALQLIRSWARERQGAPAVSDDHGLDREIRDLPPEVAAVIRALAVAGPSPIGVLAAAADVDDFDKAVRAAVEAGVVRVADDLTVRFTHTLYANAVRGGVNPLDRAAISGRLAGVVAAPEVAARHLAAATLLPDEAVADRLEQVAERCARRGRSDEAAELAAQSARLTPPERADAAARRGLREVEYRAAAGETARAMALADRLVARLGSGRRRAEALTLRVFLDFADSERFLRQALDDVGEDPASRARTLDLLGWQLGLYRGRLADGIAASTSALALAADLGDAETTCVAGATLAASLTLSGRPSDELLDDAVRRATELRPFPLGRWPRVFRARVWLWSGRLDAARREFLQLQKDAVALGSEFQRPYRLCDLALLAAYAGELGGATRDAEDGIAAARDAGNEHAIIWLAYPLGLAAALRGDAEQAEWAAGLLVDWGETNDEPPRRTMADEIRGSLAAGAGDWARALRHFTAMADRLDAMGYAHPGARPGLPRAIEAAAMVGDRDLCARLTARLREQAAALPVPLVNAHLVAAEGQLALLDSDRDRAVGCLEAAVAAYGGYRFDAGRAGLALARAWLRSGRRTRARESAQAARDIFAAAGAPGWVAMADDLLRRAGASGAEDTLTRTEVQVSALVAGGRSNREIAAELFVSVSTVEAHLTRIYRKLGLRRRTELAARLHNGEPGRRAR